jgi:hypothetical protein
VPPTIQLRDGHEILFGAGTGGCLVPFPDPRICNLHLAVCQVSSACGVSEIFDQFLDDDDDDRFQVPVYFGGPFVSDDVLMRRLESLVYSVEARAPEMERSQTCTDESRGSISLIQE